jgi:hypothetical protein
LPSTRVALQRHRHVAGLRIGNLHCDDLPIARLVRLVNADQIAIEDVRIAASTSLRPGAETARAAGTASARRSRYSSTFSSLITGVPAAMRPITGRLFGGSAAIVVCRIRQAARGGIFGRDIALLL